MATLMTIAPELRDQILEEVLFIPERKPPESPSASQARTRRMYAGDPVECFDGHDIWVPQEPFLHRGDVGPPSVLLVNRQLYHEGKAILRKAKRKAHYRLDVMYVKDCGLWPTWLSVPRIAHHADSIDVQLRVFDPPDYVDPERRNPRQFISGDLVGLPMIVWNFFALLKDYLCYGPSAFEAVVDRPSAFSVKHLILDILPPPAGTLDDNLSFPPSSPQGVLLEAFERSKVSEHWPRPLAKETHLMVAEKLAYFVASKIGGLLSRYEDHGRALYENIGSIDIRVDGVSRRLFDLDELMGIIPTRPFLGRNPSSQAKKKQKFEEWKAATWVKRKSWD